MIENSMKGRDMKVHIHTSRWNPFARVSGNLLNLSPQEFKIEFFEPLQLKIGHPVKIKIYLLNSSQKCIKIAGIVKWIDESGKQTGGVFTKSKDANRAEFLCRFLNKTSSS